MTADGVEVEGDKTVCYFDKRTGELLGSFSAEDNKEESALVSANYSTIEACTEARDIFMSKPDITELIDSVNQWGSDHGLLIKGNAHKQLNKMTEELGEVAGAFLKNKPVELEKEIGDLLVTTILFTAQNGLTIEGCLNAAWNKIKDRTGETIGGVFVKSDDL